MKRFFNSWLGIALMLIALHTGASQFIDWKLGMAKPPEREYIPDWSTPGEQQIEGADNG